MIDGGDDDRSDRGETFAALLAASEGQPSQQLTAGKVVRGRVIAIGTSSAFVEIGGKGEAIIDVAEFRDPQSGEILLALVYQI
jgi:ribosomal protein S1